MVIQVLNLDKCMKKFAGIGNIDMSKPIMVATRIVQARAKTLCPNFTGITPSGKPSQSTGHLRRSIHTKPWLTRKYNFGGVVYTATEYAPYVEFGTSRMMAQPFMIPAVKMEEKNIGKLISTWARNQLKAKAA